MNAFHPAPRVAAQTKIAGINGATCAYTTIGAAIAAAQKGDTIYIEPGEYTELLGEINLSLLFVPARARDSCRVEDTGANSATVIINGGDGSADSIGGLVKITGGAQVTFRHMTLKNASASNGGVVAVTTGGDLILDDANVTDGTASSSGGNIYALTSSGDLSTVRLINGSNVYRGTASLGDGGAIALFGGALTIDSGGIGVSSNNGFSTAANNGGGIYADGATINLNSAAARVIWNQAGNDGGGIYALNSRVNLTNAIVENNEAGASGGGIYLTRTSGDTDLLMATGASISHNEALVSGINQGGGGLYLIGAIEGELSNTTVEGNISRTGGGGLYMRTNVDLLLSNGTQIVSNQSGGAGGGVSMAQAATTLTLDNSSIADNVSGTIGGGIYSAFGSIFLRNNAVISGNQSENGGGIHVVGSSSGSSNTQIHAENSMISLNKALSNNSTVGNGGGINAVDTRIVMTDTLFTANEAQRRGGGLYLSDADSELRMTGGGFSGNRTITVGSNQGGGAVYALNNLEMFLEDVMIVGNETINSGGGFHLRQGPKLYMQGGWLGLNSANSTGGAIYAAQSTTRIVMADTLVSENSVNTAGGAFYFTFARGQFHNVTLRENTANRGGGAYFWFTEIDLFNSHVHSNSAGLEGGGIYLNGATLNLRSVLGPDCEPFALPADEYCTEVRGNRAGEYGGGLYLLGSSSTSFEGRLEAEHLAIVDNLAPLGGTAIFADGTHTPAVTLINVLVAGNGDNNDDSTAIELNGAGALQLHSVTLAGNFDNPLWMLDASAQFSLTNSIIYENLDGPRVAFQIENTLRCNLSQSPASNGRNLGTNVNPQFTTTARGAYRLGSTSPALDACNKSGLHATADISGPARDADFGFRPVGTRFDQGAFERGSTTEVFELSVSGPSGTGSGRFTSSPAGIDCPDTCSAAFPGGATVTLSATPATGSTFDGWGSAACPGTGTCELLMDGDKSVAPSFTLNSYSLTVSTNGNGNVTSNPAGIICGSGGVDCSATYDHGTAVTLSADPDGGAEFAGWSGACTGMDSCVVLMNGPRSVSAGFAQINVSHTATVMVVGTGTVTSSPQGINCGSGGTACSATYPENSGVELTATPDPGQDFAGWSGDCADAGACQLLLDADKTVTATFEASLASHTLVVTTVDNGLGIVTSAPVGIQCGDGNIECSEAYAVNTQVALTPTASAGSVFNGWSGDCLGLGPCMVHMTATRSVTASFALITHALSVSTTGDGGGQVSSIPAGIACVHPNGTTDCAASFVQGVEVTLTAQPKSASEFVGWSGDCAGDTACTLTMNADRAVTAGFAASVISHTLSVTVTGSGEGSVDGSANAVDAGLNISCANDDPSGCDQLYPVNTQVTLLSTPEQGSVFAGWSGACSGTGVCVVTLDQAKAVTAIFELEEITRDLTVAVVGSGAVESAPSGIFCGDTCAATFDNGVSVELMATPITGFSFTGWSGVCSGSGSCTLEMVSNHHVTATFAIEQVQLSASIVGDGEGVIASEPGGIDCGLVCQTSFAFGTQVTLTVIADEGYAFVGWEGDCNGTESCTLMLDASRTVAARIEPMSSGSEEEEGESTIYLPVILTDP